MYIFDIDGTIADCGHRLHYIQDKPKNWKAFYAACVNDAPIWPVINLLKDLQAKNSIVYSTGRSEECRLQTVAWLTELNLPSHSLYMRKQNDYREDFIVKEELLERIKEVYKTDPVQGIFEDRQQVVDMYRAKGLKVFQVADGKF